MNYCLINKAYHNESYENMGFIILRHVISEKTNYYWNHSIQNIRKFYGPDILIVVIDDNSDNKYLHAKNKYNNIIIVNSTYHGRGEILPYYYFYKYKWFQRAIIIHDSVFIQTKLRIHQLDDIMFLWSFKHKWNDPDNEKRLITHLDKWENLLQLYDEKKKWKGAFGSMSIITHSFICKLEEEYKIFRLIHHIRNREDRMSFERIIALLAFSLLPDTKILFGSIQDYMPWGIDYDFYLNNKTLYIHLPIVKTWTGR